MIDKPLHKAFEGTAHAPAPKASCDRAAETVDQKEARVTEIADRHFEKHRHSWAATRYKELLAKDSPAPALKPSWSNEDPKVRLIRTADHLAKGKQNARLHLIKDAAQRMRGEKKREGLER